ncbi:hypothetical protein BRARA_F03714 [Brassica rapa]|uniref:Uncharacterized protein n=1 Tax=Brassica campestris TaxID=3711 RepID=A0A397ZBM9_BRACM|nr:hypothetical protein BRARA_F03714 [Brassica rapa]
MGSSKSKEPVSIQSHCGKDFSNKLCFSLKTLSQLQVVRGNAYDFTGNDLIYLLSPRYIVFAERLTSLISR